MIKNDTRSRFFFSTTCIIYMYTYTTKYIQYIEVFHLKSMLLIQNSIARARARSSFFLSLSKKFCTSFSRVTIKLLQETGKQQRSCCNKTNQDNHFRLLDY